MELFGFGREPHQIRARIYDENMTDSPTQKLYERFVKRIDFTMFTLWMPLDGGRGKYIHLRVYFTDAWIFLTEIRFDRGK